MLRIKFHIASQIDRIFVDAIQDQYDTLILSIRCFAAPFQKTYRFRIEIHTD